MKKAFLMAGVALTLSLVLMVSLNYVVYSQRIVDASVYDRMLIDHASSRATDLYRIVHDAAFDAQADGLNPAQTGERVESSLLAAKNFMASEGLTLTYPSLHSDANRISGNYTIDSPNFHKFVSFNWVY